jgi:hypothetical protein
MFLRLGITKRIASVGRPVRHRLIVAGAGLALLLGLLLVPAVSVGAQSVYPPNTVISTYFDARYGEVSVVTDASGNLIDVNAVTGQRIFPIYPDYASPYSGAYPAYAGGYLVPAYASANYWAYLNG